MLNLTTLLKSRLTHAQVLAALEDYDKCKDKAVVAHTHGITVEKLDALLAKREEEAPVKPGGRAPKQETIGDYYRKNAQHFPSYTIF